MANPADNLAKTTPNFYRSANAQMIARLNRAIDFIGENRPVDAYVKSKDATSTDKYKVDLYEAGFGSAPTKQGIDAFAIGNWEAYNQWWPAKAVIRENQAFLMPYVNLFFLKKRSSSPDTINVLEGWPCDEDGNSHSTIAVDGQQIKVNWAFPWNATDAGNPRAIVDYWIWFRYPKPYTHSGVTTAGVVLFGAGTSIPAPLRKYVVYTPIDDTLVPTWQDIRFG